jgi:hypothetical protein
MSKSLKICPYPFSKYVLGYAGTYVPCCAGWLNEHYRRLDPGTNLWNGPAALELRRRILQNDYSLCNRAACQVPLVEVGESVPDAKEHTETPLDPKTIREIRKGVTQLSRGPTSVELSLDLRCNLKCPTCRDRLITHLSPSLQANVDHEIAEVWRYRKHLEVVKMSGTAEVFFSPDQRKLLKMFNRDDFPKLRHISILTNGLLMNERNWHALTPGTDLIRDVSISIDAGDAETYAITRGGHWDTLLKNLDWISEKRQRQEIYWLQLMFVARKANYRSMPATVELARRIRADRVRFIPYHRWPHVTAEAYQSEAIHFPDHPDYEAFRSMGHELSKDPLVVFGFELNP